MDPPDFDIGSELEDIGLVSGGLYLATGLHALALALQDVRIAEVAREGRAIAEDEALRALRDQKIASLAASEVFPAGSVLLQGPDGRPDPRPAFVAVTQDELVLLDADAVNAPEVELARIPRAELSGVRLLDAYGKPVETETVDELAEMDHKDERYAVWVDRLTTGPAGSHGFVFRALSLAVEAKRDFERALAR